jgi:hypothetical protein
MSRRQMVLACVCGHLPQRIRSVALTSEHELVFQWRCMACGRQAQFVKSLADCWRDCPEPGPARTAASGEIFDSQDQDETFLRRMGIRFLTSPES